MFVSWIFAHADAAEQQTLLKLYFKNSLMINNFSTVMATSSHLCKLCFHQFCHLEWLNLDLAEIIQIDFYLSFYHYETRTYVEACLRRPEISTKENLDKLHAIFRSICQMLKDYPKFVLIKSSKHEHKILFLVLENVFGQPGVLNYFREQGQTIYYLQNIRVQNTPLRHL